jgi:hypothetical protein
MRVFAALCVTACILSVRSGAEIIELKPPSFGEPLVRAPSCWVTPPAGADPVKLAEQCVKETQALREKAKREMGRSLREVRPYAPPSLEDRSNELEDRIRELERR